MEKVEALKSLVVLKYQEGEVGNRSGPWSQGEEDGPSIVRRLEMGSDSAMHDLDKTREILKSPMAVFKTITQKMAAQMCSSRQPDSGKIKDAVVNLTTGRGKSLTFILAAYINPGRITVVICPLVAV